MTAACGSRPMPAGPTSAIPRGVGVRGADLVGRRWRNGQGTAEPSQQSEISRVIRTLITRLRRRGSAACGRALLT